jgi:hypothetical protein
MVMSCRPRRYSSRSAGLRTNFRGLALLWATPQGRSLDQLDEILEDKERSYYEHRMAA